jgi:co-chaperonin GroES (HSP10)
MIRGVGYPSLELTKQKAEESLKAGTVPIPKGWKLLVALPVFEEKATESGIILTDATKKAEESASVVGYVMAMGEDAYKDTMKFPSGAWCSIGDFIIMRSYSGTRFNVGGHEFRLINDDTVEGVIADPSGFTRA